MIHRVDEVTICLVHFGDLLDDQFGKVRIVECVEFVCRDMLVELGVLACS